MKAEKIVLFLCNNYDARDLINGQRINVILYFKDRLPVYVERTYLIEDIKRLRCLKNDKAKGCLNLSVIGFCGLIGVCCKSQGISLDNPNEVVDKIHETVPLLFELMLRDGTETTYSFVL